MYWRVCAGREKDASGLASGSSATRRPGCGCRRDRRRIGYVPQDGALFPHLSVRSNLLYGQRRNENADRFSLDGILEVLEIGALLGRSDVAGLSGGERQRVALARALLSGPELLLLDEPLASLDVDLRERILPYLRRVRDEFRVPMLLVTHSPAEVMALCDEALILEAGQVVRQGHPSELFVKSSEPLWVRRDRAEDL